MKKITTALAFAGIFFCSGRVAFAQVIKGTYAIKNVQTGMLLRIKDASKANGTPLVSYNPVNWKCMTWDFQHKEDNTYQLRNLFSGKTFQQGICEPRVLLRIIGRVLLNLRGPAFGDAGPAS